MQYQGSKQRLMKIYAPIIGEYLKVISIWQKGEPPYYTEPFMGGGNSMLAVSQWCDSEGLEITKVGNDGNKYLVELFRYIKRGGQFEGDLPLPITKGFYESVKEAYKKGYKCYQDWVLGAVGFHTFNAEFMGTFTTPYKDEREAGLIDYSPKRSATAITALFIVLYALLRVVNITTGVLGEIKLRPSKALRSQDDKPRG